MTEPILPPLKPISIKDRISVAHVEKGNIDVLDGAFVVVDKNGVRTHIPVRMLFSASGEAAAETEKALVRNIRGSHHERRILCPFQRRETS